MEHNKTSFNSVFRAISVLASVRVVSLIVNLVRSKIIALLMGATGIGFFSILLNLQSLSSSVFDLGVSKSSVRTIAQNSTPENLPISVKTINILLFIFAFIGSFLIFIFSDELSYYLFNEVTKSLYIKIFAWSIFFNILFNGQQSILQGMRQIKQLAKSTVISSLLGLVFSIVFIYYLSEFGIILSFVVVSLISFVVSKYYVYSLKLNQVKISMNNFKKLSVDVIQLGTAMMLVSVMVSLSSFLLKMYITQYGDMNDLGIFQAGFQILNGYFGIIFTSIAIDYFPRISSISNDNAGIQRELNQQCLVILLLIFPLIQILVFFSEYIIAILYSSSFSATTGYILAGSFGIIFFPIGQVLGMVLLAKNNSKVYLLMIFVIQLLFYFISVSLYSSFHIVGLGFAFSINMLLNMVIPFFVNYKLYKIGLSNKVFLLTLLIFLVTFFSYYVKEYVERIDVKVFLIVLILILTGAYSLKNIIKELNFKSKK
ncbi:oligosaccharide flippase family protein [Riemerella anatipestifer]|uniref:oligosaccharide flippase family protein n=1 Tax=Riemerella anatipestifer TaxID=34085 RepID=UPI0021D5921B|nr:oligosaccharide flippase family protein [Riemerella anatipestifer]MCU7570989.1 oligosaccharide flippase family protein [Riemerella anatipestifer]